MKCKIEDKFDKMSLDDQEIQTSNDEIEDR